MSVIVVLVIAAVALAAIMTAAWAFVLRTGNHGWVDVFWTYGIGVVGVVATVLPLSEGQPTLRAFLVAFLVGLWSLRLGTHIALRTAGGGDDPRYAQLKTEWGAGYRTQLLLFLQIQAGAAFILVAAAMAAAHNPLPLGFGAVLGTLIAAVAVVGEAVSDAQLSAFRANPANKGKVCDVGLWALSRHPNYFFEWLYWLALVPIGVSFVAAHPWGWATLLAPLLMYVLLAHVSGVPPLEAHMLRSRGEAFRDYQRRVRAFWPIPKGAA